MYDAPRIWAMVQDEAGPPADNMVYQFNRTSQYVDDTRLRLAEAGKRLAQAWSGSEAAQAAQTSLTEITESLQKDSVAYVTATRELDNVINRLAEAKENIKPIYDKWVELNRLPQDLSTIGISPTAVVNTDEYQQELHQTNAQARDEMRKLDRDLSTARITQTEEYTPTMLVPTQNDMELAGINPQNIAVAHGRGGGGVGGQLAEGGHLIVPPAPGGAGVTPSGPSGGIPLPRGGGIAGVIGGADSHRPAAGMMGGAMGAHGGHGGHGGGAGGGKASERWTTRRGVDPVIDSVPPPDPSTMGVDDSFDRNDR
jgi:hypothetical protein